MSAYLLVKWLDKYIKGLMDNRQDVPTELHEVRRKLNELTYFDDHC